MKQSPSWEANRSSLRQEIPHILWNAKVHYRIHIHTWVFQEAPVRQVYQPKSCMHLSFSHTCYMSVTA